MMHDDQGFSLDYLDAETLDDYIEELEDSGATFDLISRWKNFREDLEGYCPDWRYGDVAVNDRYMNDYLREMIEDVYELPTTWPYMHLDWDAIIRDAKYDYSGIVSPDGITYWVR